jgi:6-phosphogluconolactonase
LALNNRIVVAGTALEAARLCGQFAAAALRDDLAVRPVATLAISGGSTPKPMFEFLAHAELPWNRIHVFFVDERPVPPDHEQSNFRLANEALFQPAAIPPANVHRIEAELGAEEAAKRYAEEVHRFFKIDGHPDFTVLHLGMGPDAHTASLFPGVPEIFDRTGIAGAPWVEKLQTRRITLLPAMLFEARQTLFLLSGADKAAPLREVLLGAFDPARLPAQLLRHHGHNVHWFVDRPAASELG